MDMSRREVLRHAVGGALVLCGTWLPGQHAHALTSHQQGNAGSPPPRRTSLTAWVRISPDGAVSLIASQSEMGQGITTTLAAALADELYLSWESVKVEFAPYDPAYRDPVYNWMFTGNSQGSSSF